MLITIVNDKPCSTECCFCETCYTFRENALVCFRCNVPCILRMDLPNEVAMQRGTRTLLHAFLRLPDYKLSNSTQYGYFCSANTNM